MNSYEMMMLDSKKVTLVIEYLLTHLTFHHHASLWQIGRPNLSVQKFGRCVSLSRYTGGKPFYERKTTCIIIGENDQRNMFICTCSLLYLSKMMFIHILGFTESFGQLHGQDKGSHSVTTKDIFLFMKNRQRSAKLGRAFHGMISLWQL